MPTLYVERVPTDLYEALRSRARSNGRSIASETMSILKQMVPTEQEKKRRVAFYNWVVQRRRRPWRGRPGPSAEEMLREDRER